MTVGSIPYAVVDVFTDRPLEGNQLAVFTDGEAVPEELMQPLARETNFSETVFLVSAAAGGDARARIFTPAAEIPFAGHPVLGTAVLLANERGLDAVRLETGNGIVPVAIEQRGETVGFGRMTQPIPTISTHRDPEPLLSALGLPRSELPIEVYDNGLAHVYVALPDVSAVEALDPDMSALARIGRAGPHRFIGINCFAGSGARWTTRMFSPADGIPEDPATGSAAGPLACHLARHGWISYGQEIEISQGASIGRPSTLFATATGSAGAITGVVVGGSAVVVARGAFTLPDHGP